MKKAFGVGLFALLVAIIAFPGTPASAQPAAAPTTFWNFLGIPQGWNKVSGALVNRNGNHPGMEKPPALKSIADAANLESPNPAIKKAAEIKQQEDLKKQKIKAIKYLSKIGCGCYPNVKKALLAALDDCTEEVRYEAAMAFCKAAGDPCQCCGGDGCCAADVMTKLHDIAYGRDAEGCYKEPSARVRQVAANALNACRNATGSETNTMPVEEPQKPEKEVPLEPIPAQKEALLMPFMPFEPMPAPKGVFLMPHGPLETIPTQKKALLEKPVASRIVWVGDIESETSDKSTTSAEAPAASLVQPAGYSDIQPVEPSR